MKLVRVIRWVATGLATLFLVPIVAKGVELFAERRGWDSFIAVGLEAAISNVTWLVEFHWIWLAAGLFLGLAAALWLQQWLGKAEANPSELEAPPTKEVFRRHYRNERVSVDGITFYHCLFENVSFHWEGGRFALEKCVIRGNSEVLSHNRIVRQAFSFWLTLGAQKAGKVELSYYHPDSINPEDGSFPRQLPPDTGS